MTLRFMPTDTADPQAEKAAGAALYDSNIEQTGIADRRPVAAVVTDLDTGLVIGGVNQRGCRIQELLDFTTVCCADQRRNPPLIHKY